MRSHLPLSLLLLLLLAGIWMLRLEQAPMLIHLDHTPPLIHGLLGGDISPGEYKNPGLGGTQLEFGGPVLDLIHLPVAMVGNPILGVHLVYAFHELLMIGLWLFLGLRSGLRPSLVWTSGLIIAASLSLLGALAENAVLCGYLHVSLFIILVFALGTARRWAYVLAGVVAGLALAVHTGVTLLLAPGWLLATLLTQQTMPRKTRLLWLGAGFLPVLLFLIPFTRFPSPLILPEFHLSDPSAAFDPGLLMSWLWSPTQDPLWMAGIVLLGVRLSRGRQPRPYQLLAALWMLIGVPLYALGHTFVEHVPNYYRQVALLPGVAILDAMVLTWLAEWLRSRSWLGAVKGVRYAPVLMLICLLLTAFMGNEYLRARSKNFSKNKGDRLARDKYHYTYYEALQRLPWVQGDEPLAILSTDIDWTIRLLQFTRGGPQRFKRYPKSMPSRCAAILGVWPGQGAAHAGAGHLIGGGEFSLAGTCLAYHEGHKGDVPARLNLRVPPVDRPEVKILVQEEGFIWTGKHPRLQLTVRRAQGPLEVIRRQAYGAGVFTIYRLPISSSNDNSFVMSLPARPDGWRISAMVLDEAGARPTR